jgi:hypothetical protein
VTTVHVLYVVAGTVTEETLTAGHITTQRLKHGGAKICMWDGGRRTRVLTYRRVERMDQTYDIGTGL